MVYILAFLSINLEQVLLMLGSLVLTVVGATLLYGLLFYSLQTVFRQYERDIALVTLNVSANHALLAFILTSFKVTFENLRIGNWKSNGSIASYLPALSLPQLTGCFGFSTKL